MRQSRLTGSLRVVLALLGPVLPMHEAQAQLIENAYPRDVPGFDTAAGVSVTSRIQTDTAWQNIPLGAELLHPEVTESTGYDSAILAGQRPSWIVTTAPSVTLTSTDGGTTLGAVASATNARYLQAPDQSTTDWTAAIGGTVDIADCRVTAAVAHFALHENDNGLDAAEYDTPLSYHVDVLRLSALTPPARLTLEPSVALTRFTFGNATIDQIPAPQSYRDRLVGEVGLALSYGIMGFQDPNRLQLILRGAGAHYPNESFGQPPRDFIGGSALLGVEHDLDGIWGWRVALGFGKRVYSQAYLNQTVPLAEMALTWQPSALTTWHAALFRKIEDAQQEGVGGYVATIGGLALDQEINRHLILHLGSDIERATYADSPNQTIVTGRTGLLWLVNAMLRVNADVTLSTHRGVTTDPYAEDAVLLSITAGL
ncbi:outer membrane beta-barrel protein [Acidisoma cellulosilytica]|uniref:Outer membrane beta-barrel protein n=1 Tax=Acidisoma cellulosilyticum TaxID=2802395 RepID=A0A963YYM6_9PROT|nr:outer membrane beta-barrel protein [Acidisoma cellulosilyticum]MCB8879559.1 outer membrane beta-barrel protein [Acidisoma cellulosilyticum]